MKGPLQRQLWAWKWTVRNFFVQRWREVATEAYILAHKTAKVVLPRGWVPPLLVGRLHLKKFEKGPNLPEGWEFHSAVKDRDGREVVCFRLPDGLDEESPYSLRPYFLDDVRSLGYGDVIDLGLAGCHLVVTAGKNYVAGCFNNTNEAENLKYHAFGTGTTAAAAGDTALQTEETTQYAVDNTRPTGSQAVATNVYTTVGTYSPDSGATRAITEWGLLSQAATGGGTLLDRQVFSAVNLVAGSDSLQTTYTLTIS